MKCSMCENTKTLKISTITLKYRESGLENVILHGVKESRCDSCGEIYYNLGDVDKLHNLIASHLIQKADLLTSREVRFLRKYLGFSGSAFAKLVGYEVEHLSRIENGKATVQEQFDKLIRAVVADKFPDRDYTLQDLFLQNKVIKIEWLEFSLSGNEWKFKKSA